LPIIETRAEQLLQVLKVGTVSTNVYLRRIHNFAVEMNWLAWPIVPKRKWPVVRHGEKRAILKDEHDRILERETNAERHAFYRMCWHLGGSQTDIAMLSGEDIDWTDRTISFERVKVKWRGGPPPIISFGQEVEAILNQLPKTGPLFPYLRTVRASDRATEFKQRCTGLKIEGVTLHSYRYAWAERAKKAGMPERFAMQVLGHGSRAVHRAYARKAQIRVPCLEEYERQAFNGKVIPMPKVEPPASINGQAASSS
jgi:integrase